MKSHPIEICVIAVAVLVGSSLASWVNAGETDSSQKPEAQQLNSETFARVVNDFLVECQKAGVKTPEAMEARLGLDELRKREQQGEDMAKLDWDTVHPILQHLRVAGETNSFRPYRMIYEKYVEQPSDLRLQAILLLKTLGYRSAETDALDQKAGKGAATQLTVPAIAQLPLSEGERAFPVKDGKAVVVNDSLISGVAVGRNSVVISYRNRADEREFPGGVIQLYNHYGLLLGADQIAGAAVAPGDVASEELNVEWFPLARITEKSRITLPDDWNVVTWVVIADSDTALEQPEKEGTNHE